MEPNRRYILDVISPTTEDLEWLDRTIKNIADLLNSGTKFSDTSAVLVIAPLEEDGHEQDTNS